MSKLSQLGKAPPTKRPTEVAPAKSPLKKELIDPNTLDWSDEDDNELNYLGQRGAPPEPKAPPLEEGQTEQERVIEEHKRLDYKRGAGASFKGEAVLHPPKGLLEREKPAEYDYKFEIPLPYVSPHVTAFLGAETVKKIWREFLDCGADQTEMIQAKYLQTVAINMKYRWGVSLPFGEHNFGNIDSIEDYISFKDVLHQLYKPYVPRAPHVWSPPRIVPRPNCCALRHCNNNYRRGHRDPPEQPKERGSDDEDDEDDFNHCLRVTYNVYVLERKGNVRNKDVFEVMRRACIPFEKNRLPAAFWELRGELLMSTEAQLEEMVEAIRSDMDIERLKDPNDLYPLPNWLRFEFDPAEILMYKHHFMMIDVDQGGSIDVNELQQLTKTLGNMLSLEQCQVLLNTYDADKSGTIDFAEFMMLVYKIQKGVVDIEGNALAQSMLEAKAQLSIFKEINDLQTSPVECCHIHDYGGIPVVCDILVDGPRGSMWEGGRYLCRVAFLEGYPYLVPDFSFPHRVFHPNLFVQLDGSCILPYFKALWHSRWTIRLLLEHVVSLFKQPDLSKLSPQMLHAAKAWYWWKEEERRQMEASIAFDLEMKRQAELARQEAAARRAELEQKKAEEAAEAARKMQEAMLVALGKAPPPALGQETADKEATESKEAESKVADSKEAGSKEATDSKVADSKEATDSKEADRKEAAEDEHELRREEFSNMTEYHHLTDGWGRVDQMHVNTVALYMWGENPANVDGRERLLKVIRYFIDTHSLHKAEAKEEDGEEEEGEEKAEVTEEKGGGAKEGEAKSVRWNVSLGWDDESTEWEEQSQRAVEELEARANGTWVEPVEEQPHVQYYEEEEEEEDEEEDDDDYEQYYQQGGLEQGSVDQSLGQQTLVSEITESSRK